MDLRIDDEAAHWLAAVGAALWAGAAAVWGWTYGAILRRLGAAEAELKALPEKMLTRQHAEQATERASILSEMHEDFMAKEKADDAKFRTLTELIRQMMDQNRAAMTAEMAGIRHDLSSRPCIARECGVAARNHGGDD